MITFFSTLMYCCSILTLCPFKIKKKEFFYLLVAVLVSSFFIDNFLNSFYSVPILILFLFLLIYYKTKNMFLSIFFSILSYLMGVFGEVLLVNISVILYANINNFINGESFKFVTYKTYDISIMENSLKKYMFVYLSFMSVFPYILSKPVGYYIKHKTSFNEHKKPTLQGLFILVLLIILFLWYYIWLLIGEVSGTKYLVLDSLANLLPLAFLGIFIIAFYILTLMERNLKIKSQNQMMSQLQQYTESIEKLYNSIKIFRHDYINVLSTMSIFITEKKFDELEIYFNNEILPTQSKMNDDIYKLSMLGNIKIVEIKGLVAFKAIVAQDKCINFIVDITEEIFDINLNVIDLSKIVGILLDNAIEESQMCSFPFLNFCIIKNNKSKSIIIKNRCRLELALTKDIFNQGFSTKGENRGIGMYNVKTILEQNNNCLLETKKENDEFTIKIDIYD